jgi:antitoxin ParD1/3/4
MSPEDEAKLAALREAVQIGFDDIEAGRYVRFKSAKELGDYLDDLIRQVIEEHEKDGMLRD